MQKNIQINILNVIVILILICLGENLFVSPVMGGDFSLDYELLSNINHYREIQNYNQVDHWGDNSFYHVLKLDYFNIVSNWQYKLDLSGIIKPDGASDLLPFTGVDSALKSTDKEFYINEAWIGTSTFEIGKKNWTWGYGFTFSPTYPLDKGSTYWGAQIDCIVSDIDLSLGAAYKNKDNGDIDDKYGASWLLGETLLYNNDIKAILCYQKESNILEIWNFGAEITHDLQNGWVLYGGYNQSNPESSKWMAGGHYAGANIDCIIEYCHKGNNFLNINLNNFGSLFNNWLWEVGTRLDLADYGQYYHLDAKYTKFKRITPSIIIENFAGPEDSMYAKIPSDFIVSFLVNVKLIE